VLPAALGDAARNRTVLAERITDLGRHGLIGVAAAGMVLPRKPAVLLVARTAHARVGCGGWADVAIRLLRAAVPEDSADPAARAAWRSLLPLVLAATDPARRLDGSTTDTAWLLHRAASYLAVRGQRRAAETLARDADDLEGRRERAGLAAAPLALGRARWNTRDRRRNPSGGVLAGDLDSKSLAEA